MKYLICPFLITLLMFCACRNTKCKLPALTYVQVNNFDSATDKSMTFYRYSAGSNFTKLLDSVTIAFNNYNSINYDIFTEDVYDYILVIHPSGVTHTLKNISFGHEKGVQNGKAGICETSYNYDLDDSNYHFGWFQNPTGYVSNTPVIVNN